MLNEPSLLLIYSTVINVMLLLVVLDTRWLNGLYPNPTFFFKKVRVLGLGVYGGPKVSEERLIKGV
jgi:hypothetical protein